MAKNILLKPRVEATIVNYEATEKMTQNLTFRVQESARAQKLQVTSM